MNAACAGLLSGVALYQLMTGSLILGCISFGFAVANALYAIK